jgi:predicted nucleic acid-binding protein
VAYLLDTNLLVRLSNARDVSHLVAKAAIAKLHRLGDILHVTPQVLIEFRNVATRPLSNNGLGLSAAKAETESAAFEATFPLLPDTPDIFSAWKAIVSTLGIIGKQVHDVRLVAVCHVHAITHLLTFNISHFAAMTGFGPGIVVVDPASV